MRSRLFAVTLCLCLGLFGCSRKSILEMAVVLVAMLRTRAAVVGMLQAAVHPDRRSPQMKPNRRWFQ